MTDVEYLKWVAEHMVGFHFGLYFADMTYINDNGIENKAIIEFDQNEEDLSIFKRLVDKAIKNEKNLF